MMDAYAAGMDVTPHMVAERLRMFATTGAFYDLDEFEPETARDIAILYEARTGACEIPGFEIPQERGYQAKPIRVRP